jgi:pyruvate carboxylase
MGQPYGGFPEPLRTKVLRDTRKKLTERPGKSLLPIDLSKVKTDIEAKHGFASECDVASYTMYPKVFNDYREFCSKYGDLSVLPTKYFLARPDIGEEFSVEIEKGKILILRLLAVGPLSEQTGLREVFFEMNGEVRQVTVTDRHAGMFYPTPMRHDH